MSSTNNGKKAVTIAAVTLLAALAIFVADEELSSLRGGIAAEQSLSSRRGLSIDLGGGDCQLTNPETVVPNDIDFFKTLLVGFPSGDKRMAYIQMEALLGWPAKDDWDFIHNGYSNAPVIKTNYPHPASKWSWDTEADQVALVVQYIRRSMVEYSDIDWYMSFHKSYNEDRAKVEELYGNRNQLDEFYSWRDEHVLQEIYKYGWYIDYWMENGLMRDPFTHEQIDGDYWKLFNDPAPIVNENDKIYICHRTSSKANPLNEMWVSRSIAESHIDHGDYQGTCAEAAQDPVWMAGGPAPVHPEHGEGQDPNCAKVAGGSCRPVAIISSDKLRTTEFGPAETEIIGNILLSNEKTGKYVINKETWTCLWDKIIQKNEGPMTFDDRQIAEDPNFSEFMLHEMLTEVNRLITKYGAAPWTDDTNAIRLVSLLNEHVPLLQTEINEVVSGARTLSKSDILGPNERKNLIAGPEVVQV